MNTTTFDALVVIAAASFCLIVSLEQRRTEVEKGSRLRWLPTLVAMLAAVCELTALAILTVSAVKG